MEPRYSLFIRLIILYTGGPDGVNLKLPAHAVN